MPFDRFRERFLRGFGGVRQHMIVGVSLHGKWHRHRLPESVIPDYMPGLPFHAKRWRWDVGIYPLSRRSLSRSGYAASFDQARAHFEAAWKEYLPQCTETDFIEHRRQRAWTAWKYAMHERGLPLPTQLASGRARCFCGASIDIAGTDQHIHEAHLQYA
jgi:hypothetical protein